MNKQELEQNLNEIQKECDLKKNEVVRQFCDANNPYKVGDKFTDHAGTIIIEKIGYLYAFSRTPSCIYYGLELKIDGTPKKNNNKRKAYQSNGISI